jgi:hypothetical protein
VEYETHEPLHRKSSLFTDDEARGSLQIIKMLDFCYVVMQLVDQDVITYTTVKSFESLHLYLHTCGLKNIYKYHLPIKKYSPPLNTHTHFFC